MKELVQVSVAGAVADVIEHPPVVPTPDDLPASPGGPTYVRHYNPDAGVWAYRAAAPSLTYRDRYGQFHTYRPGENLQNDLQFRSVARKMGLTLVTRAERRAIFKEEKRRYAAIVRKRGQNVAPEQA